MLLKEFRHLDHWDLEAMAQLVESLKETLISLDAGEIPDEGTYTEQDLSSLLASLVAGQRNNIDSLKPGSWCVAPDFDYMPSDAREGFVYVPTYATVAILTKAFVDWPDRCDAITGYEDALRLGMGFCTHRRLQGHGIEAFAGFLEALELLCLGRVPYFLATRPDFSPQLLELLRHADALLGARLSDSDTKGGWYRSEEDDRQREDDRREWIEPLYARLRMQLR